eukprot:TRINITY_DN2546_c0_g1_i1.p1 TRINITY_DN2546_c0_g1~~TRINITY_DN2546_c0_g1_i1.p1  ORF type:complete len:448 (+),score=57.78 TRINITY_DN2546_c0_g1_i1:136-1479(+)
MLSQRMLHKRSDAITYTLLRQGPGDSEKFISSQANQSEIVEVVDRARGATNGYVEVRLTKSGETGWIKVKYLHACPEEKDLKHRMLHERPDAITYTLLRRGPQDSKPFLSSQANQSEIVEVVDPARGSTNGYVEVRLPKSGETGWIKVKYLHACPEVREKLVRPVGGHGSVNLPRWLEHRRSDSIPQTVLRFAPSDSGEYMAESALQYEVVEVVDRNGPTTGYLFVRLALSGTEGWIKQAYLHDCPEGTRDHKRLAGEGRKITQVEISPQDERFKTMQKMITESLCSNPKCRCSRVDIRIKKLVFLSGQYLGETGMKNGPKETFFHGCPDHVVQPICNDGFDDHFSSGGAFGPGCYFSPQACKAFSYAENNLLVCEVALGIEENRLTLTVPDRTLDYDKVFVQQRKRSVQCHAGAPYNHEERIVYHPTQCKPVYIVETTTTSPGGGV